MAERLEVYKCEACGNIVEVLHGGAGELVCCGEPMVHRSRSGLPRRVPPPRKGTSRHLRQGRNLLKPRRVASRECGMSMTIRRSSS